MRRFSFFLIYRDHSLGRPPLTGHTPDPGGPLAVKDCVVPSPARTPRILRLPQFHRCSTGDSDFPQLAALPEPNPLAIRREEWASPKSWSCFRSLDRRGTELIDCPEVEPVIRLVHQMRSLRRQGNQPMTARNRKWKTEARAAAYITQPLGRVHRSPIQLWDNTGRKPPAGAQRAEGSCGEVRCVEQAHRRAARQAVLIEARL
jgi:hypothetical protein